MDAFLRFFARKHTLAVLITTMTVLLGLNSLMSIKRDVFPDVEFGEFVITTIYPGASPEDVELNVTNRIEEELAEIAGLDRYTSYSMENMSTINVLIDPNVSDQDDVRREIREAVNRISDLPPEIEEEPSVVEIETAIFPVIEVGLSSNTVDYRILRDEAKKLEKALERLPGVSSVERRNYLDREIKVEVSPERMDEYQVSLRDIVNAIAARNVRMTGGTFESFTSERTVVTLAEFETPDEVSDVVVRSTFEGPMIRIRDLATVADGFEEPVVLSRMNGVPAISFLVNKKENADVIRTVDSIKKLLEEVRPTLPDGVAVEYSADMSKYVKNRLQVVMNNGMIGLGLVVLVLTLFLNLRSAFWTAMGIPVTALGVIFLLPKFDSFLDVISMAAMIQVIGIIVDDAIIIAENIHKYRERGYAPVDAAVAGLKEVFWPVTTTIVTTFIAFAPMFFMSGIMGKFVFVIPLVMSLALFISLFEAIVALPAHLIWGIRADSKKKVKKKEVSWFDRIRNFYRWSMRYVIMFRYVFIGASLAALVLSVKYAQENIDIVLFPSESADTFMMMAEFPTGTSLQATAERMTEVEGFIDALPDGEVESYVTRIGMQDDYTQPGRNENWALIIVSLTPYDERTRIADEIVEDLRTKTDGVEDLRMVYVIDSGGPPVGRPITFRVIGVDDDVRQALADSVVSYMSAMDGITDIDRNDKPGKEQVEIRIDYARLAQMGLTVADVAQSARFAYDGELVTDVRYGDEDVDFRVQLEPQARGNQRYLENLLIPNYQGRLIRLGDVASLRPGPGPSTYYHFDGERSVMITSDIVAGVTTSLKATNEIMGHFDMKDWPGTRFVVGGEAEETQESMNSLLRAFLIALIGIYFVLILLFNSAAQPFLVMVAIPFGIMGVIIAFGLHGQDLGFLAMMGVVGLSGIVVNDALVLVNHTNALRKKHPEKGTRDLVAQGASDRLRAVLLTTITTVVGLLPLAYGVGGSDPFIAPMALAMGYGILFASPLTLGLVPCLYAVGEDLGRIKGFIARVVFRVKPRQSEEEEMVESLLQESHSDK